MADAEDDEPEDDDRDEPEDDVDAAGDESSPPDRSSARGPSTEKVGTPPEQSTRTSTFWLPSRNSTSPADGESSIHQPAAGALARTGVPLSQEAKTVPPAVACSPAAPEGAGAAELVADADVPVAARGTVPGAASASTRDTARNPRPTAATAEAVHAVPSTRVRFMAQSVRPAGLRRHQGPVKLRHRSDRYALRRVSVPAWPRSSSWKTTNASARP